MNLGYYQPKDTITRMKTDVKSSISFTVQQVGISIAHDIKIENLAHVVVDHY